MSKRKPFRRLGWIWDNLGFSEPCCGASDNRVIWVMEEKRDHGSCTPIPVEVRERLPACKHENTVEDGHYWGEMLTDGLIVCTDCGAWRDVCGDTRSRWRKPGRAR